MTHRLWSWTGALKHARNHRYYLFQGPKREVSWGLEFQEASMCFGEMCGIFGKYSHYHTEDHVKLINKCVFYPVS